jgi:hypothetical protein
LNKSIIVKGTAYIMGEPPTFLANLTNLISLDAEGCGLCKLPDWLGTMKELKHLNLSDNDIEYFRGGWRI